MIARLNIQLPAETELRLAPQRSQLATLRVALAVTECAVLSHHDPIRWSSVQTLGESRSQAMASILVNRIRELHALAEAYDQLLVVEPPAASERDDDIPF